MQLADMDGLFERIEEAVEGRNGNEDMGSKVMILAAQEDALIREIEHNYHRQNSQNLLDKHKQLDTNVMYDPATRTGIVCVNGRCITNTPGGKNSVIQEERLGTMRPGPKPQHAGPRMIDQNGTIREHPHHRHGQASNDIPLLENMWTDGMISKDDVAEPGQKAIDFSGGQPKNPQSGQQFNNKKDM